MACCSGPGWGEAPRLSYRHAQGAVERPPAVRPSHSVPISSVARPATSAWCGEVRAVRPPRRSPVLPNFNSRVSRFCTRTPPQSR